MQAYQHSRSLVNSGVCPSCNMRRMVETAAHLAV